MITRYQLDATKELNSKEGSSQNSREFRMSNRLQMIINSIAYTEQQKTHQIYREYMAVRTKQKTRENEIITKNTDNELGYKFYKLSPECNRRLSFNISTNLMKDRFTYHELYYTVEGRLDQSCGKKLI